MFFLATADEHGQPDCPYKGGEPGFVHVLDEHTIAFPSYDGNGMFKSFGNVLVNPEVGLLFISFERQRRLRLNGTASIDPDDPLLGSWPGAMFVVRVRAREVFPNCPRYIHRMRGRRAVALRAGGGRGAARAGVEDPRLGARRAAYSGTISSMTS